MAHPSFSRKERARIFDVMIDRTMPEPNTGCVIWLGATKGKGYGHLESYGKFIGAHQVSYRLWVGPIPDGHVIRHKCDTPCCVNPLHLRTGTAKDNVHDCIARNRARRGRFPGESNHNSKLTAEQIVEIRGSAREYGYRKRLSAQMNVSESTISKIVSAKTWGHL